MSGQNDTAPTGQALPVPVARPRSDSRARPDAAVSAQLLGAGGARRGLRGGPPVLQAARAAYLQTQWSGGADRRTGSGGLAIHRI